MLVVVGIDAKDIQRRRMAAEIINGGGQSGGMLLGGENGMIWIELMNTAGKMLDELEADVC